MVKKKKPNIRSYTNSAQFREHAERMGADIVEKKESYKIRTDSGSVHIPKNADLDRHYRSYLIRKFIELGIYIFLAFMLIKLVW